MEKTMGYAARLRWTMAEKRTSIRDLSRRTLFSYEHLRKVCAGMPVLSQACNAAICSAVGLQADTHEMWELAQKEKLEARFGSALAAARTPSPIGQLWRRLSQDEQQRLLRIADGWLALREEQLATRVSSSAALGAMTVGGGAS